MKSDGNLLQGYDCQTVVDGDHQVIVAMGVSNQPPESEHLVPMLERTMAYTAQVPEILIADAGYRSEENAKACEERGVDPHIAMGRMPHGQPPPPIYGPIPKDLDAKGRDGPQATHKRRPPDLRQAQNDRGSGVWSNQGSARAAAVSIAWPGQGEWGMDALGHDAQHQQAVAPPEETEAAGGDGNGIGGAAPGLIESLVMSPIPS